MVNNFDKIIPLLKWRSEDDFYFIQILQRKKDHKENMKVSAANNNSRLIKAYYLKSLESLEFYKPEIIQLCEVFNARAGINLNRRSFKRNHLLHQKKLLDQSLNDMYDMSHKAYSSIVGKEHQDKEKKWIIDVDNINKKDFDQWYSAEFGGLRDFLNGLQPEGDKIITVLPTKSGFHVITKPFNVIEFKKGLPGLDIQKNNPTNLYIP